MPITVPDPIPKQVYLIRHGKSSWDDAGCGDRQRPLVTRGIQDATTMGRRFAARRIRPEVILTSPAVRARTTAELVAAEVGCGRLEVVEMLYPGTVHAYLDCIDGACNMVDCLFLVAHNHALTDLASHMTGELFDNIVTTGVVGISFARGFTRDPGSGKLLFYDYPKKHADSGSAGR